jgi:hypothetical protein
MDTDALPYQKLNSSLPEAREIHRERLRGAGNAPIIFHPDKVEAYIDLDRHSVDALAFNLWRILDDNAQILGSTGGDVTSSGTTPMYIIQALRNTWSIDAPGYFGRVQLYHLPINASSLRHEELRKAASGDIHKKYFELPPGDRISPTWTEMFQLGFKGSYLALMRITDPQKWMHRSYNFALRRFLESLADYGITLVPRVVEGALDTVDESKGKALRMYATLDRFNPGHVFHFENGSRRLIPGGAAGGLNEYCGYRPKKRDDSRPNSVRPRGGRLQLKTYEKMKTSQDFPIHRLEVVYYRDYLRACERKEEIGDMLKLLDNLPKMVRGHLRFELMELGKLYADKPEARGWGLEDMTTKGMIRILKDHGLDSQQIRKYRVKLPAPNIVYEPTNDHWYATCPRSGCYRGPFTSVTKRVV